MARLTRASERLNVCPTVTPSSLSCLLFMPARSTRSRSIFRLVQRKVLTPNHFPDLNSVAERLLNFQYDWEDKAKPFQWKFIRKARIGNPCCPQEPQKYVSELLNQSTKPY